MGSEESVAALPTSVAGDFYSPEALRRRLPVESVGSQEPVDVVPKSVPGDAFSQEIVVLPSSSSPVSVLVKQPPRVIRQSFTGAEWASWAACHGVRLTLPVQVF